LSGGAVKIVSQSASILLQLTSTVILARLLGPEEYGIIAMVTAVVAFAGMFRDLGLSSSTIQKDKLTHEQLSTLFWVNVLAGTALTVIVAAVSPLVAWFYQRPELTSVTLVLSLSFVVASFSTQQRALLVRQMRFGREAVANIIGGFISLMVAVAMAVHGFGYWSLVASTLSGSLISTILVNVLVGWRPGLTIKIDGVRSMLTFGARITGFECVNYFHRNLDNLLIGRFWGADLLGLYSRAYSLLMFPINNLRGPVNAVGFPAMSRLQGMPDEFRRYYQRLAGILAFFSMPLTAFLFVGADPIIEFALGRQWLDVVPIFAALALVGFVQPVVTLWGIVVLSTGRGERYLRLGILNSVCAVLGFLGGLRWGAVGVAYGYAAATYLSAYPILRIAFRGTSICFRDFLRATSPAAIASFGAVGITVCLRSALISNESPLIAIGRLSCVFPTSFFAILLLFKEGRGEIRRIIRMAKALRPIPR
jgi:PST family polysaccharide transporter